MGPIPENPGFLQLVFHPHCSGMGLPGFNLLFDPQKDFFAQAAWGNCSEDQAFVKGGSSSGR